jgi:hypothetical protein
MVIATVVVTALTGRAQSSLQQGAPQQQTHTQTPSEQPATESVSGPLALERIRAGLQRESVLSTAPVEGPIFKTEVTGHAITLKDYWLDDSNAVSSRVQWAIPYSHLQFQQMWRNPVGNTGRAPFQSQNPEGPVPPITIVPVDATWLMNAAIAAVKKARKKD